MGFVTPAIGPNKSKKPTWLIAPVHNTRGKVWMKQHKKHGFTDNNLLAVKPWLVCCFSNFPACIVCRCYKPCEFLWFVWTDCWGNKSNYVITSPANSHCRVRIVGSNCLHIIVVMIDLFIHFYLIIYLFPWYLLVFFFFFFFFFFLNWSS